MYKPLVHGNTFMATAPIGIGTNGSNPPGSSVAATVDGTPVRVVVLALSAALGLAALKMAGFRFNVGVSS